jgi:hypothetical protein
MLTAPPTPAPQEIGAGAFASPEGLALGGGPGVQALPGPQSAAIADLARSNPQSAALVLKKWMKPTA